MAISSVEAAFGKGAESVGRFFASSNSTGNQIATKTLGYLNELGKAGKSMLPYWKPLALGTGAALGLATVLSTPPMTPSLRVPFVAPNMESGTGGQNIMANVHPNGSPVGSPGTPDFTSSGNSARLSVPGHRVRIKGHSRGNVDYGSLQNSLRQSLGGNVAVNTRVRDHRKSLTPQRIADIVANG